jgi:glycosyltransferase involved in cell wall biosynthesis
MVDLPLRLAFLGDPNSRHTRRWIGSFLDRGHEVHLMVPAHDTVNVELDPRILVHRFTAWPKIPIRGVGSVATALSLRRSLAEVRPDVLHAHSLNRYGVAARLSGFHPYVVTVWGSDVLIVLKTSRLRRIQGGLALHGADLVTGGSDHLIRAAIAAGARRDRTRFVHFGVDTLRFAPGPYPAFLAARLGVDGRRVLLSNRTIAPLYRHGVVLEAVTRLPSDVVVIMTRHAARPAELAAIERHARDLGLADRVRIVDEISDEEMPDLYRLADVVVSVPASDGGPTTIVEALAVGRPVVATDLPSVREWLGELDAEAMVPVDDVPATAEAILRVLTRDPDAWADHARQGRAAVAERADQLRSMGAMEAFYRELAAGRPRG